MSADAGPYMDRIKLLCENAPQLGDNFCAKEALACSEALDEIMKIIEEWGKS